MGRDTNARPAIAVSYTPQILPAKEGAVKRHAQERLRTCQPGYKLEASVIRRDPNHGHGDAHRLKVAKRSMSYLAVS